MKESQVKQERNKFAALALPVILGIIVGLLISVILLAISALIFTIQDIPQTAVFIFSCFTLCAGAFFGSFFAARFYRNRGLAVGALTGLLFFLIIYLTGVIMSQINIGSLAFLKLAICVICGCFGGIIGVNTAKRNKYGN